MGALIIKDDEISVKMGAVALGTAMSTIAVIS